MAIGTENEFRQIFDSAPDAMVVVDAKGIILFANRQIEGLFGYQLEEVVGAPLDILLPVRFRASHGGHFARYFAAPTLRTMGSGLELAGCRKDGSEIPIEVSLSPVHTHEGILASAAIRDVQERRRVERERIRNEQEVREARAAAERASAAKSEFLASMSHELRTPLNAILGFTQLLERDKKEPLSSRHRERLAHIAKGGEHLLRLIDDILDLARIESGRVSITLEAVEVGDVLRELRSTLTPLATRYAVALEVAPSSAALPSVAADRTRLTQIVMNYASNAIKYNRPNGLVTLACGPGAEGYVRISVTDTGMGIPKERQHALFQPFQRAGQETGTIEGTGIGLVITKRLAELMGGAVGFESTYGEGSTFWADIPVHIASKPCSNPPEVVLAQVIQHRGSSKSRVLYIEDNAANVAFMREILAEFEGIEFISVPSAERGIEWVRNEVPSLVLMDINLPGMNGLRALQILREEHPSMPIIAVTAAASEQDRASGLKAGFFRYLTKPVRIDELMAALGAALARTKSTRHLETFGEGEPQ